MNKKELVRGVADECEMTIAQARDAVDATFELISDALVEGEKVQLHGFGIFSVASRKERTGRNPHTGESIRIPAKDVAKFKPSKELNTLLND